ncbi:MAG: transferrin-binding protein-like solute binding protein [Rhodospirillaceae bacterium]|nr:transferrin-binding protein-like solute binding protein [Rhodospirillaceae bacterium]
MSTHRNLMTVCFAAVFALGLAACSSSKDDPMPPETDVTDVTDTNGDTETPAEPTDLETTQAAAMAAADAAKAASDAATAAATGATSATANLATLQTGEMAGMHATAASDAADTAMAEYMKAKAASEAAAAATMASAAGAAKADAEAAQAAAQDAAKVAADKAKMAMDAAKMELMIDGKVKSVGESMLNAGDGMLTTINDDKSKTITGRLDDMDPMETAMATEAVAGKQDNPNIGTDKAMTPMVAAEERSVTVGRTLDSSDDAARLMLMTHYAGSKTVGVYSVVTEDGTVLEDHWTSTKAGQVVIVVGTPNTDPPVPTKYAALRPIGEYYPVTVATDGTAGVLGTTEDTDAKTSKPTDSVAKGAEPKTVYTFEAADETRYVVLNSSTTSAGTTTNTYRRVDTMIPLQGVGSITDGDDTQLGVKHVNVVAKLPEAMAYDHIHFGVWADLSDAEKDGSQTIDDLGIGFVQSVGAGMTGADMPNAGKATYSGNWAAAVQQRNAGTISLENGAATLTANLDKSTLEADLNGLATLSGAIDGSSFSGTKATDVDGMHGLNSGGTFSGTFSGGFYGPAAAEAGGIFDFSSKDMADGAFRGAFGGAKDEQ